MAANIHKLEYSKNFFLHNYIVAFGHISIVAIGEILKNNLAVWVTLMEEKN